MAGDANYPNVSLLLHCDGANNSTTFTDSGPSPKTVAAVGNAKVSTAQSKFGGASLYCDGAGDALTTPNHADLLFGAGDFTIECWIYTTKASQLVNFPRVLAKGDYLTSGGWNLVYFKSSGLVYFDIYAGGAAALGIPCGTVADSTWAHMAITRSGSTVRSFLNGVKQGEGTNTTNLNASDLVVIGGTSSLSTGGSFAGHLDEIRHTKGVARYTADFTPQSAKFLDYAGQIEGVVKDDAAIPAARTVRAYRRDTGALVSSVVSNGSSGAYTINCPTLDECSVVCLDDSGGTLHNDLIARVVPS